METTHGMRHEHWWWRSGDHAKPFPFAFRTRDWALVHAFGNPARLSVDVSQDKVSWVTVVAEEWRAQHAAHEGE